jgi:hypothetical protein
MNMELVNQLHDRAAEYADNLGFGGLYWQNAKMKKFAELVVKECILQCNDGDSRYFIATHFGISEPRGWICPKCGVDRTKEVCPSGYNSLLVGQCPMIGEAQ